MGRKRVAVLPQTKAILEQLGEQIKTARLRRRLSAELVAQRAGVSRATVWNVEKGNPSVAIDLAIGIAPYCGLNTKDAVVMAEEILRTVRENWSRIATEYGLSRSAQEYMRPAFSLALDQ